MESLQILVVEDETLTAADIKETLQKAGHRVTATARNFQEAVAAVKKLPPDLALIDVKLEESSPDGIATAKELLSQHWMPIIYLTGHSEQQTFQRAKDTYPAAYLLKPFRHNELALQVELAYHHFRANGGGPNPAISDNLYLPINKGYEKIAKSDVLYLLADGSYAKVYVLNESGPRLFTMNLGYLAQYFDTPNFYRLSRSLVINLNHLERLERNQLFMKNHNTPISIPEGNRADLMRKLTVVRTR